MGLGPDGARRIDLVRDAVNDFITSPEISGVGVGISYFGANALGSASCDPTDFSVAAVDVAPVTPAHANVLTASLATVEPTGETPTGPAIEGGCMYVNTWSGENPGRGVVMLVVTDGIPGAPVTCDQDATCCPSIIGAVEQASACLRGDVAVRTYVLGVGPALDDLNSIASAGGTDDAYLVTGDGDVAAEVVAALHEIRNEAVIPCELKLPVPDNGEPLETGLVNVQYRPNTAEEETHTVYFRESLTECDAVTGGWFYEEEVDASADAVRDRVILCPATCSAVTWSTTAELGIALGCASVEEVN